MATKRETALKRKVVAFLRKERPAPGEYAFFVEELLQHLAWSGYIIVHTDDLVIG